MEEQQITLQIDHHFITVPAGTTLLEAARKIGIDIPTLCHINLKGTCIKNNPASCRICVVEVEGRKNLAPACATRCTDGMVVRTSTLRVMNARKIVAELILSDHLNPAKRKATPIKNEKRFSEQKRKAMKIIKAILEIVSPLLLH